MLNTQQQEAAQYISGPLLILAGAGAGKTKTIVERVINIIKSGIAPHNILCVTFTNKAASEMRERIYSRLKQEGLYEDYNYSPMIKTFHSLGLYILKQEYAKLGLTKNFTILDSDDSKSIIKNYLDSVGVDTKMYEPNKIRGAISREKSNDKNVEDYRKTIANYSMEINANSWEHYNQKLKQDGAVDFDDLIILPAKLLRENKDVREKYQDYFKYIHVDEYQDTNQSQYELCKLLVNQNTKNICVVGDTDQNIYSWRGANLKNIMNFESDYTGTKTILLEENYRSTGNILSLANTSIKKNKIRQEKNLFTRSGAGEKIKIMPAFDGESEAECIAKRCKQLIANGADSNSMAVLYRTNFQSRVLEEKMLSENVPYSVLGIRFFERKEIKDIMSYLRLALNENSSFDLKRVLETPKRGIGKVTIAKILSGEELNKSAQEKVNAVYRIMQKIKEHIKSAENTNTEQTKISLSELLTFILIESGLEKEYQDDGEDGANRLLNVSELIELSRKYDTENISEAIDKFLETVSLTSDQDDEGNNIKEEKASGVRLMTVHASKGLEFDYVFIAGLEEDLFPAKNFSGKHKTKEEEEEERRLFYVAVTRARRVLFLSYAEMRTVFGQRNIAMPSQFLEDLHDDDMFECEDIYYKQNSSGKTIYI
jgi:DNA helicase II / ATP-dependent DNA helicase PcrA